MCLSLLRVSLISICLTHTTADFLGPRYPVPVDLSSRESLVGASWRNLSSTLQTLINGSSPSIPISPTIASMKNVTFSLGMFSLHDPAAARQQFHYTSPEIASAPNGTHKVDEDSIYRIASITKIFTVLAGLLELNNTDWSRPLTDIFPTFAEFSRKTPGNDYNVYNTQWDKATLSNLAAQISGIGRDPDPGPGEILLALAIAQANGANQSRTDPAAFGLPPLNPKDPLAFTSCILSPGIICPNISSYIESVDMRAPIFQPWTTPDYSNNGFALLGQAIASITGKTLDQIYRESIFEPLDMASSNSSTPPESEWHRAVIPGDLFAIDTGVVTSSGGLLSTLRDLTKLGVGILNSTLLPSDRTRQWLKPLSHTARLEYSVGQPWEIFRHTDRSGVVTDIYSKLGDSGDYSGLFVLLPDYDAGFNILAAGTSLQRARVVLLIADLVTDIVLPTLAAQAAIEAERNLAGSYTSTMPGLNSSLTLSINKTEGASPGLEITSWISNGTDMFVNGLQLGPRPWRILPSIRNLGPGQAAFRFVNALDAPNANTSAGLFTGPGFLTADWIGVDSLTYGGIGMGLFVFDIASNGKAEAVSPAALRVQLKRTS